MHVEHMHRRVRNHAGVVPALRIPHVGELQAHQRHRAHDVENHGAQDHFQRPDRRTASDHVENRQSTAYRNLEDKRYRKAHATDRAHNFKCRNETPRKVLKPQEPARALRTPLLQRLCQQRQRTHAHVPTDRVQPVRAHHPGVDEDKTRGYHGDCVPWYF